MSVDFRNLERSFQVLNQSVADMIHVDVTDGVYIPTLSLGYHAIRAIGSLSALPLDFHLMMIRPEEHLENCKRLGAQTISVQFDALREVSRVLRAIRALDCRVGLAVHPHTRVEAVKPFLPEVDVLLLLAVLPGFGGQSFMPDVTQKVRQAKRYIEEKGLDTQICVDGGVTTQLVPSLVQAGADILVAGHAVFGSGDVKKNILHLKMQHEAS